MLRVRLTQLRARLRGLCWVCTRSAAKNGLFAGAAPSRHTPQMRPASSSASWYLFKWAARKVHSCKCEQKRHAMESAARQVHSWDFKRGRRATRRHSCCAHLRCQACSCASWACSRVTSSCMDEADTHKDGSLGGCACCHHPRSTTNVSSGAAACPINDAERQLAVAADRAAACSTSLIACSIPEASSAASYPWRASWQLLLPLLRFCCSCRAPRAWAFVCRCVPPALSALRPLFWP